MNEIRRVDRDPALADKISDVVEGHGWPNYIGGYRIVRDEFDGEAAWRVIYRVVTPLPDDMTGWEERGKELNRLTFSVGDQLRLLDPDLTPLFAFESGYQSRG